MMAQQTEQQQYRRFAAAQRFEHSVLLVSMVGLALTGLTQKFAGEMWAQTLIQVLGGIESTRILHRFSSILLMAVSIYHGGVITYKIFVLGYRATMIPGIRDLRDLRDWIFYNLGLKAEHPHLPRYNFGEKAEYLAVVWGTLLMGVTGFMMWNPIATANIVPGEAIPAARAAHGGEAILAILAIVTWHMYNVHFKRFNRSMFTGKMSREAMLEEHAEELEAIERGEKAFEIPAEVLSQRKRRFWPFAILMTIILVAGAIWFVTFEETAITTIPRQPDVLVFAPQSMPETGAAEVGAALWPTLRCAQCHGIEATGGPGVPPLLDTTLSFDEFYQQVREGDEGMPPFGAVEIADAYLLHLWTWLTTGATE